MIASVSFWSIVPVRSVITIKKAHPASIAAGGSNCLTHFVFGSMFLSHLFPFLLGQVDDLTAHRAGSFMLALPEIVPFMSAAFAVTFYLHKT